VALREWLFALKDFVARQSFHCPIPEAGWGLYFFQGWLVS
jgi:hypothetical protein